MTRARKRRSPRRANVGFGKAQGRAAPEVDGKSASRWIQVPNGDPMTALTQGTKRLRIVTSYDDRGRMIPPFYVADNKTRIIHVVGVEYLERLSKQCDGPEGEHLRHLVAMVRADQAGLGGSA